MDSQERQTSVLVLMNSLENGGAQRNAVELADAVRRHGYRPTLMAWNLAHDSNTAMLDVAAQRGLQIEVRDRPPRTLAAANIVAEVARQHGCRLVHSYGWTMFTAFWGAARWGRMPLVSTIYEMHLYDGPPHRSSFVFGTEYQCELVKRHGPMHLLPPPVDTESDDPDLFAPRHEDGSVRIAIISRLAEEMKALGIEAAIKAMHRLPSNVELVITGDGSASARLREMGCEVNSALSRNAVRFTGNAIDARPFYAQADIVLGMGGSAARGLAFAKPLVALGDHGWSELFTPASAQRLSASSYWSREFEAQPQERLVAQLLPLIESQTYRRTLGSFGRSFIEKRQGLRTMAGRLAHVYGQALASHKKMHWYRDALSISAAKAQLRARTPLRPGPQASDGGDDRHSNAYAERLLHRCDDAT
jgi:hypothetical protein